MSMNHHIPKKISLKPKKHHGFQVFLFLLGFLLPPLAVAARFGIGTDFFINTFLCICGYFPCHFHNFYIQNIRNNANHARTPKWAIKAGLIDDSDRQRRLKKNQWSKRFDERNAQSTHVGQELEEGESGNDYLPVSERDREAEERRRNEGLWGNHDEEYYNPDVAPNQSHWHYPANFEGAVGDGKSKRNNAVAQQGSGDRWERSRATRTNSINSTSTYPPHGATDDDVPEWGKDYGSKKKSNKSQRQPVPSAGAGGNGGRNGWASGGGYVDDVERNDGWGGGASDNGRSGGGQGQAPKKKAGADDFLNHDF